MIRIEFSFNAVKTAEAIIYIATKLPRSSFMSVAKLLYFADKSSLESYGQSITGDKYVAMQHGPVPSAAYDMMKASRDTDSYGFHVEFEYQIVPDRQANLNKFSEADLECLDSIIKTYGHFPTWQLREFSHDEAWRNAWEKSDGAKIVEMPMDYEVKMPLESVITSVDDEEGNLLDYLRESQTPYRTEEN